MQSFDYNLPGGPREWSPLHVASWAGSIQTILALILNTDVDVFARSACDELPRHVARNPAVTKVLRQAEARATRKQLGLGTDSGQPTLASVRQALLEKASLAR